MNTYWQRVRNIFRPATNGAINKDEQQKTQKAIEQYVVKISNKDTLLLDAGCSVTDEGNRLYQSGFQGRYFGVDNDSKTIRLAKKNQKHNDRISFYFLNLDKLHFKDKFFDIVLVKDLIENEQYYVKTLTELIRVAKRYLILSMSIKPSIFLADKIKLHQNGIFQNRYNQGKLFGFILKHHFKKPLKIYEDWQDITFVFEKVV